MAEPDETTEAVPPRAPGHLRTVLARLLVLGAVFTVAVGGVWVVATAAGPSAGPTRSDIPALSLRPADVEPGSEAPVHDSESGPRATDSASATTGRPRTLQEWADRLAPAVGVPPRALLAYGNAELIVADELPGCGLSWSTLAGIGRVESDHGRHGGAVLGDDGRPSRPIIGIALDGSPGVKAITDTDGGVLDGDAKHDRAVGPMQFIPSTWSLVGVDASGDGRADPQQIDDAALSAAFYLCAHGRDLATGDGWWDGVLSYNHSVDYGRTVFGLAEHYAELAAELARTAFEESGGAEGR
ncbi:lytic transglycosylase domain-containing protein [Saccharomonospora xinjiangensis]|uniref:Membrane-bound lytic murein transglycosylase B n=1 Tax=Saccharomonospora xinjiangensis XJ-54 TaxID=882086 RepID=I0V709_9PSEU|nr:membrane-bound lytic murein transglycosylase B [Saccharomonospora xinjiangensis XJ-54]